MKEKKMAPKKKVSFWATKQIPKKVKVNFRTSTGKRVSFTGTKKISKRVKVSFWVTKPRRKR